MSRATIATVATTLANHPDGITTRALAAECGLGLSTVGKALAALENEGSAYRTPGQPNGNRKTPDIWRLTRTTDNTAPDQPAPTPSVDDATSPTAEDTSATDETAVEATANRDEAPIEDRDETITETEPNRERATEPTDDAIASDDTTRSDAITASGAAIGEETADTGTPLDAHEQSTPADPVAGDTEPPTTSSTPGTQTREPDLKVMIMAGVLGSHPDGISASAAITESGLAPATGDTILAAMEIAGAARRLPPDTDGVELWVRGEADLATVDPANAPTHVTCPTCGHTRRIRRPSARRARTGRATDEVNTDGSARLGKNGLRHQVEAFVRDLGPGHDVTPGTVARELGGRSSGAVANAMSRLTATGVLTVTREAPMTYALAPDAPAPTPEVTAYQTTPLVPDTDQTPTATPAA